MVWGSIQIKFALLGRANILAPRIAIFFRVHSQSDFYDYPGLLSQPRLNGGAGLQACVLKPPLRSFNPEDVLAAEALPHSRPESTLLLLHHSLHTTSPSPLAPPKKRQ